MITAFKLRTGDTELEVVRVSGGFRFSDDFAGLYEKSQAVDKIVHLICENDPHFQVARNFAKSMFHRQLTQTYASVLNLMD